MTISANYVKGVLILVLFFSMQAAKGQESISGEKKITRKQSTDVIDFGIGAGLDYGGYGGQFLGYPQKNIGIILGIGYNGLGLGYNAGLKGRLLFHKSYPAISPFVLGMYGYTSVVNVKGPNVYNSFQKQFNSFTIGAGLDIRIRAIKIGYFSLAALLPLRGSDFDQYIANLKNNYGVKFNQEPSAIGLSLGYKFILSRGK